MKYISKAVSAALGRLANVKNMEFQDVFRDVLANDEALQSKYDMLGLILANSAMHPESE